MVVLPLVFNPLRRRDTDVKNRLLDYMGEGKGGMICENRAKSEKLHSNLKPHFLIKKEGKHVSQWIL